MESLTASGSFNNWCSGLMSSTCSLSCSDKQHYHRHCSCSLHSIESAFKGSPCSPTNNVKVSGSAPRSAMYRSLSVQNFGEKKYSSAARGCYGEDSSPPFDFSPRSDSGLASDYASDPDYAGSECLPSADTVMLVEELANFICLVKDDDSGSSDDEEAEDTYSYSRGFIGESTDAQVSGSPAIPMSRSLSSVYLPGHQLPLRVPRELENMIIGTEGQSRVHRNVRSYSR